MKTKMTLKYPATRIYLLMAMCFAVLMAFAPASRAGLNGPYTPDFYTLHLWHLQDTNGTIAGIATNGVWFYDSQSNNLSANPLVASNYVNVTAGEYGLSGQPGPGDTPYFQTNYGTNFGYNLSFNCTTDTSLILPVGPVGYPVPDTFPPPGLYNDGYAYTNNSCSFVNTNTGAYTWEALIQPAFGLATTPSYSPEILCSDGGNSTAPGSNPYTARCNQLRVTGTKLEWNGNINAVGTMIHDVFGNLPSSGPDAFVQGNWYHVAVAFTGTSPTNGDPPDVLTMYWTAFNASHTYADVLTNFQYFYTYTNSSAHTVYTLAYPSNSIIGMGQIEIGNEPRNNGNGWVGSIAEVRISDYYRHSNEFMFNTAIVPVPPQVTVSPTNSLVGYGYTLNLTASASGTLPYYYQWYQNGAALAGQTNAVLSVTNLNYNLANDQWYVVVTNGYGSPATSSVATVTLGATFDGLFNTGCDPFDNPVTLSDPGSVDLHWTMPANPETSSDNAICWSSKAPIEGNPGAGSVVTPTTESDWIGPLENSGLADGTYTFQTTFQVDETLVTPTNFIAGTFGASAAQNGGTMQMFLNGVETDFTTSGNPAESLYNFVISNGLQQGSNVLTFTSYQGGGTAGNAAFNLSVNNPGVGSDTGVPLTTSPAIVNQPVGVTNVFGSTVSFQAVALGAPPLMYYWLSNGVAVTQPAWVGTAVPYLSFVGTNFSSSQLVGTNYFANLQIVFSNFLGSVTSTVATLNIQIPPQVLASAGVPIWDPTVTETNIVVYFTQPVDPVTGATAANYTLNGASVLSAVLGTTPGEVVLTTSTLNPANSYTLTVQNVNSTLGTALSPSPASVAVGTYPANVALWVKASTGITTDSTGTNVTQWNDLSGNGNNLQNADGLPYEPQIVTNNGYAAVQFEATNETFLEAGDSPSLEITSNLSVFAVVNFATLAGGTNGEIIGKTGSSSQNVPAPYDYYANSGGVLLLRGNGSAVADVESAILPTTGVTHILDAVMNGTSVTHRLDGDANGTGTLNVAIGDQQQEVFIGTREDQHNRLTGDLYELILIGSPLSSSDVASMESYLAAEYNLPLGVPLINPSPTPLGYAVTNGQLTLSWPTDHTGWQLQAQTNAVSMGIGTNWSNYNPSTTVNQVMIPINLTNGTVFYRLIYAP